MLMFSVSLYLYLLPISKASYVSIRNVNVHLDGLLELSLLLQMMTSDLVILELKMSLNGVCTIVILYTSQRRSKNRHLLVPRYSSSSSEYDFR